MIYTRAEACQLLGMSSNSLNQRTHQGEIGLSFGRSRPLHTNEYRPDDCFMVLLTAMAVGYTGASWKDSAAMVRKHWEPLLRGLATAERDLDAEPSKQTYLAIGLTFDDDNSNIKKAKKTIKRVSGAVGEGQKAITAVETDGPFSTIFMLSLQRVRRQLKANSETNKLPLPDFLTPGPPESAEFKRWVKETVEYQGRIDKAKSRKPKVTA